MVKKREDLQRVLKLVDKALRNVTSVKMSHASRREELYATPSTALNPWEKNNTSTSNEVDWSVVKSKKSLIG